MSRSLQVALVALFLPLFFISCQKEVSFEIGQPSKGSLQNALGECSPKTVGGTFKMAQALGDTNYIDVTVDVTQTGVYTIYTDTVNGYSFRGTGNFSNAGSNTVRLKGVGTPTAAGIDAFTVQYDTSFCMVAVTVLPNGTTGGGTAVFTLQGGGGACTGFTIAGAYAQGTPLTGANTVQLQLNVTTPGTWTLTSNSVGGMSFSGSGTFASAGSQTITLTGTGTPTAAGAQTFTVSDGTNGCTFVVTVTGGGPAQNMDHFPLTPNSYWTYNDAFNAGDTLKRINDGSASNAGLTYRVFTETDHAGDVVGESYFRRAGSDYFEYTSSHYYALITFDDPVPVGEILFLKEGLNTGDTWNSVEFSGKEGGVDKKLRYNFTCTDNNATVTVNGKNFTNVYKITWKPQVAAGAGAFVDEGLIWESWYARGVGLIYTKVSAGPQSVEGGIRFWQVL